MAVQSPPSQQPLEDSIRMGQNVNTKTLSMSAPKFSIMLQKCLICGIKF